MSAASGEFSAESIAQLAKCVEELAQNVRVLTDLVEATREDVTWIAHNGIPHQTLTVRVLPTTDGAKGKLVVGVEAVGDEESLRDPPATSGELEQACEWLGDHITELLQEQLNLFLEATKPDKRSSVASVSPVSATSESDATSTLAPRFAAQEPQVGPSPAARRPSALLFPTESVPDATDVPDHRPAGEELPVAPTSKRPGVLPPIRLWEVGEAVSFCIDGREAWGEIILLDEATNTARVELIPSGEEVSVSFDVLCAEEGTLSSNCVDPLEQRGEQIAPGTAATESLVSTPAGEATETLIVSSAVGPFSLARFASVHERLRLGRLTAHELRQELNGLLADRNEFCAQLAKRLKVGQLRALLVTLGCPIGPRPVTKANLAMSCFQALVWLLVLERDIRWQPGTETYEDSARSVAETLTDDDVRAYVEQAEPVERPVGEFVPLLQAKRQ